MKYNFIYWVKGFKTEETDFTDFNVLEAVFFS